MTRAIRTTFTTRSVVDTTHVAEGSRASSRIEQSGGATEWYAYPKTVVYIGGTGGCGKTELTNRLAERRGFLIGKQKRALIEVAKQRGIRWEDIPSRYDDLIGDAAALLSERLSASPANVMLIDCHYAFKKMTSIALNLNKSVSKFREPYIQGLDERLIETLRASHTSVFVLLRAEPAAIRIRLLRRRKNAGDDDVTIPGITRSQAAERRFFRAIVSRYGVQQRDWAVIDASGPVSKVLSKLSDFVSSVGDGSSNIVRTAALIPEGQQVAGRSGRASSRGVGSA